MPTVIGNQWQGDTVPVWCDMPYIAAHSCWGGSVRDRSRGRNPFWPLAHLPFRPWQPFTGFQGLFADRRTTKATKYTKKEQEEKTFEGAWPSLFVSFELFVVHMN